MRLKGKTIIITAAGQGIGRASALAMAREGATVWATDVNPELLKAFDGVANIKTAPLNVLNTEEINALAQKIGTVDVLFNCAGYVHQGDIMQTNDEQWDFSMDLNVKSMYRTIRAFLPGMLAKGNEKLKHINLPAEDNGKIKPSFLKVKYKGGLLDELRLNSGVLKEMLSTLGSYGYAGQMMQEPAPSDGGMIKKDWFVYMNFEEFKTKVLGKQIVWNYEVDGAFTSKKENAQSAILAWCYIDNTMYIREVIGVWEEMPDFINTLKSFVNRNEYSNASRINIEAKATGLPIIHTLRRTTNLNVIEDKMVNTTGTANDKISRVHGIIPFLEGRRCVLIKGDWNESFVHQCAVFPKGKLKDKVDCLTAAISKAVEDKNSVMGWAIG